VTIFVVAIIKILVQYKVKKLIPALLLFFKADHYYYSIFLSALTNAKRTNLIYYYKLAYPIKDAR
jgi:hypothetical protein